jgi:hypothetical protein
MADVLSSVPVVDLDKETTEQKRVRINLALENNPEVVLNTTLRFLNVSLEFKFKMTESGWVCAPITSNMLYHNREFIAKAVNISIGDLPTVGKGIAFKGSLIDKAIIAWYEPRKSLFAHELISPDDKQLHLNLRDRVEIVIEYPHELI